MPEDTIAMELGVEPQLAVDLMTRIKHGNPVNQQLGQPAQRESLADSNMEPERNNEQNQRGGNETQKPKGKAKAKAQAKARGSEMECELMEGDDLDAFVSQWIRKAAAAQGQAASVSAQLEQFESQEQLCGLIRQAGEGLALSRKELIALKDVTEGSVTAVLQKETGLQTCVTDIFFLHSIHKLCGTCKGEDLRGGLQKAHQDCESAATRQNSMTLIKHLKRLIPRIAAAKRDAEPRPAKKAKRNKDEQ